MLNWIKFSVPWITPSLSNKRVRACRFVVGGSRNCSYATFCRRMKTLDKWSLYLKWSDIFTFSRSSAVSERMRTSETYKACSKKDRTFAIKTLLLILQPSLKRLNHSQHCVRLIRSSPYAWLSSWNVSVNFLPSLQQNFTHSLCSSGSFIVTLSPIRRTACAHAQFTWCSSTTNAHSETGQMAVCCQNLTLGALSSRSALSVLFGTLFKKFGLFLNTPRRNAVRDA